MSSVVGILSPTSSPVTLSRHVICFVDSPEVGPGGIPGLSGPLSTTTPVFVGIHRSNRGAIIGGVIGGIAVISILVGAFFFYWRRRRSLVPSPVFERDIAFDQYMNQVTVLRPILSPETVYSCFPETSTSSLRPHVHIFNLSYIRLCMLTQSSLFTNTQDLDYPIMYPEYEVTSPPPAYISGQVSSLSPNRSLYTVGTIPSSQAQGYQPYHGAPTAQSHRSQ